MRETLRERTNKRRKSLVVFLLVVIGIGLLLKAIPYISVGWQTFFNKDITLKKADDRVNILLLGIGGGVHEGPSLTDTIIFVSIDPSQKKVTLISIPRDLWIPELKAKINTAYASGESKQIGGGLRLSKTVVAKILGQPLDYAIRIDFDGFIKAIDMLGGVDVTVEGVLDDSEYPITGKENDLCGNKEEDLEKLATASSQKDAFPCRYEHLHFDIGQRHMDGKTALMFVRSRHAEGEEGTDFARSKRQEKVISAIKQKVFSLGTLLNPFKLANLYQVLKGSIDTDIKQEEYDDFIKLAQKMKEASVQSIALDFGDEKNGRGGFLINPPISEDYDNQWVIIPKEGSGSYARIQTYVLCEITQTCQITPSIKPPSK